VICRIDGTVYRGRAVQIAEGVDPQTLACAVRDGAATEEGTTVTVRARTPDPVHERVGCLHPGMGLRVKTALAAAARSRGHGTAVDGEIRERRAELAAMDVDQVTTKPQREAVAAATADTERLREQVATRRGELSVRREKNGEATETARQFRETARALSEAKTGAVEARQDLRRRRRDARGVRDRLERRMALEDDLANLEREARRRLVARVRTAYERAVASVPGGPEVEDAFAVDAVDAGLAIARVADLAAPVVLACDRFESPRAASAWLGAPVAQV